LKKLLLNLYFWPAFVLITLFGLFILPFILLFAKIFQGRKVSSTLRLSIRLYGWLLVCVVPFMAPVKVLGKTEKMVKPAIFVANHTSAIDPYLFGAIPIENCFVTSWPFKIPIYSPLMKLAGYINTADGWETISDKCASLLDNGVSVTIWPEGHRSRDGQMGRFRKGAFQLSVETGFPLQPVCIFGSGKVMYPGKRLLSPGKIELILLDPLYPDTSLSDSSERVHDLRQRTFQLLENCIRNHSTETVDLQSHVEGNKVSRKSLHHHYDL